MISMMISMMIPIVMARVGVEGEGVDQRLPVPHFRRRLQLTGSQHEGGPEQSEESKLKLNICRTLLSITCPTWFILSLKVPY